jgi:hypothetical protein
MKKIICSFFLLVLVSCGPKISQYRDFQLCYDLARGANIGDHNGAIKNEIKNRALNCDKHEVAVQTRLGASNAADAKRLEAAINSIGDDTRDPNARIDKLKNELRFNCNLAGGVLIGGICQN